MAKRKLSTSSSMGNIDGLKSVKVEALGELEATMSSQEVDDLKREKLSPVPAAQPSTALITESSHTNQVKLTILSL